MVGATRDDDGGADKGAVWVLFMDTDGTVLSHQKISETQGGFTDTLSKAFGSDSDPIGDLDNDGVVDLVVGEAKSNDGGIRFGAIWILFMNTNGTVKAQQKISSSQGNFTGTLGFDFYFGHSTIGLGDLDGDNIEDIAVSVERDNDGGTRRGSVYILFLNTNGTVKSHQKISDTQGNFSGILDDDDRFGTSLTNLGDLDGDGIVDIAVGARYDDDGGSDRGALWILFLNANGTVKLHQKISNTQGNFNGLLTNENYFGSGCGELGDVNGDGIMDIVVGGYGDDDGGTDRGACWILYLNSNGTVLDYLKISDTQGGFTGTLDNTDYLGWNTAGIGDLNQDGYIDFAGTVHLDDDGGTDKGAVWIIFMEEREINITVTADTSICKGDSIQLIATGGSNYSWTPAADLANPLSSTTKAGPTTATTYTVIVTDSNGCTAMDSVLISIKPQAAVSTNADTTICIGDSIQLFATSGVSYIWSPASSLDSSLSANPIAYPSDTTTYIVWATDSNGCSNFASVTISVDSPSVISAIGDTVICFSDALQLFASGGTNYEWTPAIGLSDPDIANPIASISQTKSYQVKTWNDCGADSAMVTITINTIEISTSDDTTITEGENASISVSGDYDFFWTPFEDLDCNNCPNPIASPLNTTIYFVRAEDLIGCFAFDSVLVTVEELVIECDLNNLFVPNTFSPNGDGRNDIFYIYGNGFNIKSFKIFDRWGEKVFENDDQSFGWDGKYRNKELNHGVFVYLLDVECNDGSSELISGNVTLLR